MSTLSDLWAILSRHRIVIGVCMVLVLASVMGGLAVWPRSYQSESRLLVTSGRVMIPQDSLLGTADQAMAKTPQEEEVNTVAELLVCRPVIEKAVARVGAERILGLEAAKDGEAPPAAADSPLGRLKDGVGRLQRWLNPSAASERAADLLASSLSVELPRRSNVLLVSAEAASPELARDLVTAVVDVYLEFHRELHRDDQSLTLLEQQVSSLGSQLDSARQRLRDLKNAVGIVSLDRKQEALQQQVNTVWTELRQKQSELAAVQARVQGLQQGQELFPERITASVSSGTTETTGNSMQTQLFELQRQQAQLRAKYPETHPLVQAISQSVAEMEELCRQSDGSQQASTTTTTDNNPMYQQWLLTSLQERANGVAIAAEVDVLEQQFAGLQTEVEQLNRDEAQLADLENEVELLSASFATRSVGLDQARMAHALDEGKSTDIAVAQAATWQERPVSPQPVLVVLLGLILAVCGGMGMGLLMELRDQRWRTEADAERGLGVPVLATVPPRRPNRRILRFITPSPLSTTDGRNRSTTPEAAANPSKATPR
jgi:uncharacterized protein involved in exopolysaccharide biosynthesis